MNQNAIFNILEKLDFRGKSKNFALSTVFSLKFHLMIIIYAIFSKNVLFKLQNIKISTKNAKNLLKY